MSASSKPEDIVQWHNRNKSLYENLAKKVAGMIEENLILEQIDFHSVSYRVKVESSFKLKAQKAKYTNPGEEITDFAGIRVIAYVDSDVSRISEIIERLMCVNPNHSIDKAQALDVREFGYRSIHLVGCLPDERVTLREYKRFEGLLFEVQIRTILQHAWAEIEHDRNYKFQGVLPDHLKRRFALLAGVLELADREFDSISSDIDAYANAVAEEASKGDLDIPIDTTSLRQYCIIKFPELIDEGILDLRIPNAKKSLEITTELSAFGINTLADLDKLVPADFPEACRKSHDDSYGPNTVVGICRDIMIMSDIKKYFSDCWNEEWTVADRGLLHLMDHYRIHYSSIFEEHDIEIGEEE